MDEKIKLYLSSMGFNMQGLILYDKLVRVLGTILENMEVQDCFVCNLKTTDETFKYLSLWIITKEQFIECIEFKKRQQFKIIPYRRNISFSELFIEEFINSVLPNCASLVYTFSTKGGSKLIFQAYGQSNCDKLNHICNKFIYPNMR